MDKNDLFAKFISNLDKEVDNKNFVISLGALLETGKFSKNNYLKLIRKEYNEY